MRSFATSRVLLASALGCVCLSLTMRVASGSASHARVAVAPLMQSEHEVKAAVLFKFVGYVKWPEKSFKDANAPIVIAVVGPDPFGESLEAAFKGKQVHKRKISIVRFKTTAEIDACHLLFVAAQETPKLAQILEKTAGKPVLIVCESSGAAAKGAMINLGIENKKMRFEINVDAVKRANMEISSELLKLAKIVTSSGPTESVPSSPGERTLAGVASTS